LLLLIYGIQTQFEKTLGCSISLSTRFPFLVPWVGLHVYSRTPEGSMATARKKTTKKAAAKKSSPFLEPFSKERGGNNSFFIKLSCFRDE